MKTEKGIILFNWISGQTLIDYNLFKESRYLTLAMDLYDDQYFAVAEY